MMYLAALDALFEDLGPDLLGRVAAVNVSAQQHGQVWLTQEGTLAISGLRRTGGPGSGRGLVDAFPADGFAQARAPIWMTTSTGAEADAIRNACGGVRVSRRDPGQTRHCGFRARFCEESRCATRRSMHVQRACT